METFKELLKEFRNLNINSEEELVKLGAAHKSLPQREKNWNELVDAFGISKSGNAFRCWVNDKLKREGILPVRDLQGGIIESTEVEEVTDDLMSEQLQELYRERTKIRDIYNAYRRGLRDDARIEDLKDCITNATKLLPELPKVVTKENEVLSEVEGVLLLSDFHIGVDCNNFYNKYNTQVAADRLSKLVANVKRYCNLYKVAQLNVINLGDLIHGIIHVDSRIEQREDIIEQIMIAAELLANTLYEIQKFVPVIYRSCVDNHSRTIADKHQHIEKENLNRLIDWYIESRLAGQSVLFMHDNLDVGLGRFKLINGKTIMFAHGHQDNLNSIAQNWIGATREFVDYVCIGHYHNSKLKSFNGTKVIVNGSLVGVEEYALSKRLFSHAEQTLLLFDRDNLINITIDLQEVK